MDSHITWLDQTADQYCRITWVYNKLHLPLGTFGISKNDACYSINLCNNHRPNEKLIISVLN